MEMIKQNIRFKPEKWEKIKAIAKEENKTIPRNCERALRYCNSL